MFHHFTQYHFPSLQHLTMKIHQLQDAKSTNTEWKQIVLNTWSLNTLHMFENSKIPAGGIKDDLHIPAYDLYNCIIPSIFFNLETNI